MIQDSHGELRLAKLCEGQKRNLRHQVGTSLEGAVRIPQHQLLWCDIFIREGGAYVIRPPAHISCNNVRHRIGNSSHRCRRKICCKTILQPKTTTTSLNITLYLTSSLNLRASQ
ncbi:uncharacterized protein Bfra_010447 [Botrytis fragariae]|uniref:Uncharacterized protein n=1 Tax=Botrytis fragariae TaxID=1964551 RepID=A0A8H6AE01_9HELO|nr:uncharacterized protein Bfra_010447 [Botrytis fragariae]KAF5867473.1 hypothetical protein Bfra_010447 [Botrytis fragariae]